MWYEFKPTNGSQPVVAAYTNTDKDNVFAIWWWSTVILPSDTPLYEFAFLDGRKISCIRNEGIFPKPS